MIHRFLAVSCLTVAYPTQNRNGEYEDVGLELSLRLRLD